MNSTIKILLWWYFFLFFLVLFNATNVALYEYAPGLIFIISVFIVFFAGAFSMKRGLKYPVSKITERGGDSFLFFIVILSLGGSLYSAYFYAGVTPLDIFEIVSKMGSAYNNYQSFIEENNLTSFDISQLLPFGFLMYCRIVFFYLVYLAIVRKHFSRFYQYFLVFISVISVLYLGFSRGTTIEVFEVAVYIFFCVIFSSRGRESRFVVINYKYLKVFVIGMVCFLLFYYNQSARFAFQSLTDCSTAQICFAEDSLIHSEDSFFSILVYRLNGYFSFGIYFISKYIETVFVDKLGFLSIVFPPSFFFEATAKSIVCGSKIDCASNWVPDFVKMLNEFGVFISFIIVLFLGWLSKFFYRSYFKNGLFSFFLLQFYILLEMMSLFVGNFIMSNQAVQGIILLAMARVSYKFVLKRFSVTG